MPLISADDIVAKYRVYSLTGYSAQADQNMLVKWVKDMPEPPGEIRLVHGETKAMQALSGILNLAADSRG